MSAGAPSIKGRFFETAASDVRRLFENGGLACDRLARWLGPGDQAVLRNPIEVDAWYDIRLYARLLALLRDVEGAAATTTCAIASRRTASAR